MKKNLLYLLMLICSASLFVACSDDDNDENKGSVNLASEITGTYQGDLSVKLESLSLGKFNRNIYVVEDGNSTVKLELKDFSINVDESVIEVGDIIVPNIGLTGEGSSMTLKETSTVINHPVLGELQVKVLGTVVNEKADLSIVVFAKTLNQNINVGFDGKRISKEVLMLDYAEEIAAWYSRTDLSISGSDIEAVYPSDGISVVRKGYNKIAITSTPFSFPPKAVYISIESAELVKTSEGYSIETVEKSFVDRTYGNVKVTLSGKVIDKTMTLDIIISNETNTLTYKYVGEKKQTSAEITKMTINNAAIRIQPEIGSIASSRANVAFFVKDGTTDLSFVPEFELSSGATIKYNGEPYVKGTAIDFSSDKEFKVVSESGKTTITYNVSIQKLIDFSFMSDLNTWEMKNTTSAEYQRYQEPANGWGTSNEGVKWIKAMYPKLYSQEAPYAVLAMDDAKSGKAARLETLNTTGQAGFGGFIPAIPVVTSGTVFSGIFSVNISNTLKSTQFGYPCFKKPVSFKGSYKFSPGKVYYNCADPVKANEVTVDDTKVDLPGMNAVLYEVNSYAFDYLDGTNLLTSDKIVALASVDGKAQAAYTDFDVKFNFLADKTFDSSKKYKLAIVCSSSKDGDKFSGAPGSVLYVDNLEVTF